MLPRLKQRLDLTATESAAAACVCLQRTFAKEPVKAVEADVAEEVAGFTGSEPASAVSGAANLHWNGGGVDRFAEPEAFESFGFEAVLVLCGVDDDALEPSAQPDPQLVVIRRFAWGFGQEFPYVVDIPPEAREFVAADNPADVEVVVEVFKCFRSGEKLLG